VAEKQLPEDARKEERNYLLKLSPTNDQN